MTPLFCCARHTFCSSRFVPSHPFLTPSLLASLGFFRHYYTHVSSFPTLSLLYLCVLNCPFPSSPFPELYPNPSFHSLSSPPPPPTHTHTHTQLLGVIFVPLLIGLLLFPQMNFEPTQRFKWIFKSTCLKLLLSMEKCPRTAARWTFFYWRVSRVVSCTCCDPESLPTLPLSLLCLLPSLSVLLLNPVILSISVLPADPDSPSLSPRQPAPPPLVLLPFPPLTVPLLALPPNPPHP